MKDQCVACKRTVRRERGMRPALIVAVAMLWSGHSSGATDADQADLEGRGPIQVELSDDQLRIFVTKVQDFLYRFGQQLTEAEYEILNDLKKNSAVWNDQAYARFKHESVALCDRADSYDALGLAEEIYRIGEEYHQRYARRIRLELSQLSDVGYEQLQVYMWSREYSIPSTPWAVILSMLRENLGTSHRQTKKFWCQVANERL